MSDRAKPQLEKVLGFIPYSRSGNLMGGLLIAVSMSLFVINDSLMRLLQKDEGLINVEILPLPVIIAVRGTLVVIMMAILIKFMGLALFPKNFFQRWNMSRASVEASITFLFLSTLPVLPFAIAQTIISSNPIFLVFLGIFLFGERVGWRRWLAIVIGFAGIVMAAISMDDGSMAGQALPWWAVASCMTAAVFVALRDVFTRYVGDSLPAVNVAFASSLAVMILGWTVAPFYWTMPDPVHILIIFVSSILVMCAYLAAVFAVRLGEFSIVGPLRFVSLVVAFSFGLLFFRDPFSWLGLSGAILIVGSAIWIVLRQAQQEE